MQYDRKGYFFSLIRELKIDSNNQQFNALFNKYIETFEILQIGKRLLPRRFVLNKFAKLLGLPIPFKNPMKTKSSRNKVCKHWKMIAELNNWED